MMESLQGVVYILTNNNRSREVVTSSIRWEDLLKMVEGIMPLPKCKWKVPLVINCFYVDFL